MSQFKLTSIGQLGEYCIQRYVNDKPGLFSNEEDKTKEKMSMYIAYVNENIHKIKKEYIEYLRKVNTKCGKKLFNVPDVVPPPKVVSTTDTQQYCGYDAEAELYCLLEDGERSTKYIIALKRFCFHFKITPVRVLAFGYVNVVMNILHKYLQGYSGFTDEVKKEISSIEESTGISLNPSKRRRE